MFMNLHTLPAGQAMYTLAITPCPVGTHTDEVEYDEVDFVASTHLTAREVVQAALSAGRVTAGDEYRVIGVIDQSSAYVMVQDTDADFRI